MSGSTASLPALVRQLRRTWRLRDLEEEATEDDAWSEVLVTAVHDSVDGDEVDVSDMLLEVGPPPLPLSPGRDQPSDWVMVDVRASFGSAGDSFAIVDGGDQYDTDDDGPLEAQRREVEGADDDVIMDVELQPSLTDIPSNVSLSGIRDDFLADHAEDPVRETAEAMAMEDDGDDGCGVDCDARHTTRSTNRSEAGSDAALRG